MGQKMMPVVDRPNILLILFDGLGANDGASLHSSIQTPEFIKLVDQSTSYTNAYTPSPESSPARASLFTGLDPCVHGVWTNGVALRKQEQTFPETLALTGYTNWLVGRRQLAGVSNWTTEAQRQGEYTLVEWAHGPLHRSRQNAYLVWLQTTAPEIYSNIFSAQPNPDDTHIPPEQREAMSNLPNELSFNHWVGLQVNDMIASHTVNAPFFAVASFVVGSLMGGEPAQSNDSETVDSNALQQADTAIGQLLKRIDTCNTVILLSAARGHVSKDTQQNPMHQQSIKVPLVIRLPDGQKQINETIVSTMDIAPTILDLAGAPMGHRYQGTSLLRSKKAASPTQGWSLSRMRRCIGDERHWQSAYCTNDWKLVMKHGDPQQGQAGKYQLFNLQDDPLEQNDLSHDAAYDTVLENLIDEMIDARCAMEDRTEPRIASF